MSGLNVSSMGPSGLTSQALNELLQLYQEMQQDGFSAQKNINHLRVKTSEEQGKQVLEQYNQQGLATIYGGIGQITSGALAGAVEFGGQANAQSKMNPKIAEQDNIINNTRAREDYVNHLSANPAITREAQTTLASRAQAPSAESIIEKVSAADHNQNVAFSAKATENNEEKTEIASLSDKDKAELTKQLRATRKDAEKERSNLQTQLSNRISDFTKYGNLFQSTINGSFQIASGIATQKAGEAQQLQTLLGTAADMMSKAQDTTTGMINTAQQAQTAALRSLGEGMREYRG